MQAVAQVCSVSKTADAAQNGTLTLLRKKNRAVTFPRYQHGQPLTKTRHLLFRLLPTLKANGKSPRHESIRWSCDVSAAA